MADLFKIESQGLGGLTAFMNKEAAKIINKENEEKLEKVVDFIVERVKANVPKATGNLEQNIKKEKTPDGFQVHADTDYALFVHERQDYELGPESELKQKTIEGGPGNKYISRVIDYHQENMIKTLGESIEEFKVKAKESLKKEK